MKLHYRHHIGSLNEIIQPRTSRFPYVFYTIRRSNTSIKFSSVQPGLGAIKNSCSTQLSMTFFLLINVKMHTAVGILTLRSRKNSILCLFEPEKYYISSYFHTYEHLKFTCSAKFSMIFFITWRPDTLRDSFTSPDSVPVHLYKQNPSLVSDADRVIPTRG